MKKMKKRTKWAAAAISMLLAVCIAIPSASASAFAGDASDVRMGSEATLSPSSLPAGGTAVDYGAGDQFLVPPPPASPVAAGDNTAATDKGSGVSGAGSVVENNGTGGGRG